jgi:hypothetical protein
MYAHDAFTEIFHFNSKFISRINTAFAHMGLAHCRGVCLNTCVLHQSLAAQLPGEPPDIESLETETLPTQAVLAHTMQRVELPAALVQTLCALAAGQGVCKLKYMGADSAIARANVAAVDPATRLALQQAGLESPAGACQQAYVCLSASGTPILVGELASTQAPAPAPPACAWAEACARLHYLQAACDFHRLDQATLQHWTRLWAAAELARHPEHPERREHIAALARVQSPAVCAHAALLPGAGPEAP